MKFISFVSRNSSLADPRTYDPNVTQEGIDAEKKRLGELQSMLNASGTVFKGSTVKPLLLPDNVVNKPDVADFRLQQINREIGWNAAELKSGEYRNRKKYDHVPIGIMIDEKTKEDVILYDRYPQSWRMSEKQENFFARSHHSLAEIKTGKDPKNVHPKIKEYDWREAFIKQEMAMGRRKG